MAEEIDVVIVVHALQHGGDALEPHAGVDGRLRQVLAHAARELLVLHEDEIPDLDEAVAVFIGRAGRAAGDVIAVIVENLGAGAARAGLAHGPEIVRGRDADDARFRESRDLAPEVERLVVLGIDGREQAILAEAVILGDQLPGELDRALLEVVAEGEIPQHLEEGVVARGVADAVEVVVLAAGADAFLRGGRAGDGALLLAGEDVLELDHARVGEHQRGVVPGNERARGHDLVVVTAEKLEEPGADVFETAGHGNLDSRGTRQNVRGRAIVWDARPKHN